MCRRQIMCHEGDLGGKRKKEDKMDKYLLKNTTKEQPEQIVRDSVGYRKCPRFQAKRGAFCMVMPKRP